MPSTRTLDRRFRPMVDAFLADMAPIFPGIRVTSARRTHSEQARLYKAYLRGDNDGLPAMPPGTSDHEFGLAVDIARPGVHPLEDPFLAAMGAEWQKRGGRWNARDPVHFAAPTGRAGAVGARRRARRR